MEIFTLKAMLTGRGQCEKPLYCLKTFLRFCRGHLNLDTFDPEAIRGHRPPRREVLFLTPEEIAAFVAAIPVVPEGGTVDLRWLRFRTLVEVLLGTGMRISECLSLRRSKIDFGAKEAQIIGKGNIERTVFFTARSLGWVKELLNHAVKESDFVFWQDRVGRILGRDTASKYFRLIRRRAGMQKKVTPHMLRHTVATTLLFNGCPIGHIREILGHTQLQTTCQYYLGTDKRAALQAHQSYLRFE
jgi:site-specific recombinase XerD